MRDFLAWSGAAKCTRGSCSSLRRSVPHRQSSFLGFRSQGYQDVKWSLRIENLIKEFQRIWNLDHFQWPMDPSTPSTQTPVNWFQLSSDLGIHTFIMFRPHGHVILHVMAKLWHGLAIDLRCMYELCASVLLYKVGSHEDQRLLTGFDQVAFLNWIELRKLISRDKRFIERFLNAASATFVDNKSGVGSTILKKRLFFIAFQDWWPFEQQSPGL